MKKELRKRGIKKQKVVYSKEEPINIKNTEEYQRYQNLQLEENKKKNVPSSISFVPSVAGLIIASEVVKDIINS